MIRILIYLIPNLHIEKSMLKLMIFLAFLILPMQKSYAAGGFEWKERFEGKNCEIKVPPLESGTNFVHGIYLFVYPKDVDASYTGCQIMWDENGKIWAMMYMRGGHPKLIGYSYPLDMGDGKKFICEYENDLLVPGVDQEYCVGYAKDQPFGNLMFMSSEIGKDEVAKRKLNVLQNTK